MAAGAATLWGAEPHLDFPTNPRDRLAVTSYPFRAYMEAPGNRDRDRTKPGMDAKDFAVMVVERFGILMANLLPTAIEAVCGFVLGNVAAIALATVFVYSRTTEEALFPVSVMINSIPVVAKAPRKM